MYKVYKSHWPQLLKTIPHLATEDFNQLANHFLIKTLPAYRKAKRKVLFIGKETNGWEYLSETMKVYGSGNQEREHDSSINYLQWMYEDLRHYRK